MENTVKFNKLLYQFSIRAITMRGLGTWEVNYLIKLCDFSSVYQYLSRWRLIHSERKILSWISMIRKEKLLLQS